MSKERKNRAILAVLDGFGYRKEIKDNGIKSAKTPYIDFLLKKYPNTLIEASGRAVGLPEGQIGNSEVGHLTIGAGQTIFTDLVRITDSFKKKEFEKIPVVKKLFAHVNKNNSSLHVLSLIGSGGVHAFGKHLESFLLVAKKAGIKKVFIHAFSDGRDTAPKSAEKFLFDLERFIDKNKIGFIATLCGRYFAMDRDNNWDRLLIAEKAIFEGKAEIETKNLSSLTAKNFYEKGITDEHFKPVVFLDNFREKHFLSKNDGVIFLNFRSDRARMISKKILEKKKRLNLFFATMTEYDKRLKTEIIFPQVKIETTLSKEVSKSGIRQSHIAETEKFAHATYFLNGGIEKPNKNEKHILIESRKDIKIFDEAPEMRAKEIADKTIEEIKKGTEFIFLNFANADMVGHTGNKDAVKIAIETIDKEIGRIYEEAKKVGITMIITADHGNAEMNIDPKTHERHTAHTSNPVPLIITDEKIKLEKGKFTLSSVAPAVLQVLGIKIPKIMNGRKIIKKML